MGPRILTFGLENPRKTAHQGLRGHPVDGGRAEPVEDLAPSSVRAAARPRAYRCGIPALATAVSGLHPSRRALSEDANVPIRTTVHTDPKTRGREPWRWYAPHRAIVLLGVVLTLIALAGAFLGVANASQAESATAELTQRYLALLPPVRAIRTSASNFQVLAAEAYNGASAASLVPAAESDANAMDKSYDALQRLLAAQGDANLAPGLARQMAAYIAAQDSLGAFLAGERGRRRRITCRRWRTRPTPASMQHSPTSRRPSPTG